MQHNLLRTTTLFLLAATSNIHTTSKLEILKSDIRWTPHVMANCIAMGATIVTSAHYFGFKPIAVADHPKARTNPGYLEPHKSPAPVEAAVEIPKLRSRWLSAMVYQFLFHECAGLQVLANYDPQVRDHAFLKVMRKMPSIMLCCASWVLCVGAARDCYEHYPYTHYNTQDVALGYACLLGCMGCTAFFAYACALA